MSENLHLHLKGEYFREIAAGRKLEEYRAYNQFWRDRLEDRDYDQIFIYLGYPKADDTERVLIRKWNGCAIKTITHPLFGNEPVNVYAIDVSKRFCDD